MASSSRRHSHRHHSALSAVPSLSLSVSTSRASSIFTDTSTTSPYSSSSSSHPRTHTHSRHLSIEKSSSPPPPNEANGGRMTPAHLLSSPLPPPSQRWDDSQLALDLADDTLLSPDASMSSSNSRHTIKEKMRQWISPLKKKQRLTQWLSERKT